MRTLSSLLNWLLVMHEDMGQVMGPIENQDTLLGIELVYARIMAREIEASGYTITGVAREIVSLTSRGWLYRSPFMGLLEMADPASCFSPLHDPKACKECQRESIKPFDPDDPWGELARIEVLAEMGPEERRAFQKRP